MTTVLITFGWVLFFCSIAGLVIVVAQVINEQRPRKKPVVPSIPLKRQADIHSPQPTQERKPAPYRYVRPPKQENNLRQTAAPSPTNHPLQARSQQGENAKQLPQATQKQFTASQQQAVDSQLQKHLFTLVNGDMKIANRLLEHVRRSNPLQSEQWVWEKVIYDLERDRT